MTIMDYWVQFNVGLAIGALGVGGSIAMVLWAMRQGPKQ